MKVWGVPSEDVGSKGDFFSSAIAELQGCNECRKCRSIYLPCIAKAPTVGALIHAIHDNQIPPASLYCYVPWIE
ncbi:MAG: hypothetical protein CVV06_00685 [Gammaproteobacteria bacterium HGW-Gammaproteobacteria-10]|nr:MAG: hypothetical protein CVV06_00685 [Gammaproteobacteria bacterium HGW-Gammaproteobacteria-10]